MKLVCSIAAFLLLVLVVLFLAVSKQPTSISNAEAGRRIDALTAHAGIELVTTNHFSGSAILGGTMEKRFRDLFRMYPRETPFRMTDHRFRDSKGDFTVQVYDREGEPLLVTIYLSPGATGPATETKNLLRELFPEATFFTRP